MYIQNSISLSSHSYSLPDFPPPSHISNSSGKSGTSGTSTLGPKYSNSANFSNTQGLASQPCEPTVFPHQTTSFPLHCSEKYTIIPVTATPQEKAAERM